MSSPTRWIDVRVLAPIDWHELVAEALTVEPCTTVAFGRPSLATPVPPLGFDFVRTCYPEHLDTPTLRRSIEASVASSCAATGAPELADLVVEFRTLPSEDFANSWKKDWKPFRVGRICVVSPESPRSTRPADVRLVLEPGGAFGTGRHPTTRMCLAVLQERMCAGSRIADAGSGSGILSVAAVLLGARDAFGFDVDPNAERYARALADDNDVAARCDFRTGGFALLRDRSEPFDAVLANIYSDVIRDHAAELLHALKPGGWFAFSGCPVHHAEPTAAAIRVAGFAIEDVRIRGRWHTFTGTKRR